MRFASSELARVSRSCVVAAEGGVVRVGVDSRGGDSLNNVVDIE